MCQVAAPEPLALLLLSSKRASDAAETFTSYETFKINVVWTHEMRHYLYSALYSWQQPLRAALLSVDEHHRISYLRFFGEYTQGPWCCVPHIHNIEFSSKPGRWVLSVQLFDTNVEPTGSSIYFFLSLHSRNRGQPCRRHIHFLTALYIQDCDKCGSVHNRSDQFLTDITVS